VAHLTALVEAAKKAKRARTAKERETRLLATIPTETRPCTILLKEAKALVTCLSTATNISPKCDNAVRFF
jgi:hypothetical protein